MVAIHAANPSARERFELRKGGGEFGERVEIQGIGGEDARFADGGEEEQLLDSDVGYMLVDGRSKARGRYEGRGGGCVVVGGGGKLDIVKDFAVGGAYVEVLLCSALSIILLEGEVLVSNVLHTSTQVIRTPSSSPLSLS